MRKIIVIPAIVLASSIMFSCGCPLFGNYEYEEYGTLVKYREGKNMSNNVLCIFDRDNYAVVVYNRPMALHNGYYLFVDPINYTQWAYMPFTYDDLDNGNVPRDWKQNWEQYYDTIHNPYEVMYVICSSNCDKCDVPFRCDTCSSTHYLDTIVLNRIVEINPFPADACYFVQTYKHDKYNR